ncbi:MAG: hypothetical protein SWX82_14010 [Cyanobacteriota bacterium]|nr:hypothetical protein [Cyanobacteriota bacterium]
MRISQVTPLWKKNFPVGYSGIELIVDPLKDGKHSTISCQLERNKTLSLKDSI